jgi:rSAM/selenodomain-associated transferase 1
MTSAYRQRLVVMVKEPQPGRVKTRLGKDIGMTTAAWWFRHQTQSLLRAIGRDPRWQTILAVSPDAAGLTSRIWPEDIGRVAQGSGNLGDRMARLFRTLPPGPVVIVGSDIPDIDAASIACAFRGLGQHDAVLGPANDGGFWSIGLRRTYPMPRALFKDVRWSTAHAMADTERSLHPMDIGYLETLVDIDTGADLRQWAQMQEKVSQ